MIDEIDYFISEEEDLTRIELLGFLIHRVSYMNDKRTADIGLTLYEKNKLCSTSFTNEDAIALMHDLTLTKSQLRKLKGYLSEKLIFFPNTNEINLGRKKSN